jgi:hypothetical protein
MRKRNLAIPTAAIAALSFAAVAPSYAQTPEAVTTVSGTPTVSPSKAGTKKKPQSVGLNIKMNWKTAGPDGANKPIVQQVVIDFPKGSLYNGGKVPSCSASKLSGGDLPADVCPKGSIVGTGTGDAWADTAKTSPKFTLVNGGSSKVFLYTELTNPAVVNAPVPGTIVKRNGGYRLTLKVPQQLQVVAGTPISLISVNIKTNAASKKAGWLQTTSCPANKKWPFTVTSSQDSTADATFKSSVKCS